MDTYIIQKAYPFATTNEVEIISENLRYSELGTSHSGVQSFNHNNNEEIRQKCNQVAKLIREIDKLNK